MKIKTRTLTEIAVVIAMSTVLSIPKLYQAPYGGSVTYGSMVPIFVLSLLRGPWVGMTAGALTGFMHLITEPYVIHPAQLILDYPLPFALLGLAGFFRRQPWLGMIVGMLGRFASHFLSGIIFFQSYAEGSGLNPYAYSAVYNAAYLVPELIISLVLGLMLYRGLGRYVEGQRG
jgi:thiamine transporter